MVTAQCSQSMSQEIIVQASKVNMFCVQRQYEGNDRTCALLFPCEHKCLARLATISEAGWCKICPVMNTDDGAPQDIVMVVVP